MLDFFEANKGLAEGKFVTIHGKQDACKKWDELAELLNKKGAVKTGSQWQTTWRDLKSKTSVKARERRKEMAKTGGRPLTLPALTEIEKRVFGIIGEEYAEGSKICPESFPEEEQFQFLLESGNADVLYAHPMVVGASADVGDAVGRIQEEEEDCPVEQVNETAEVPTSQVRQRTKTIPKRNRMDLAREQFANIAKKQAEAIMIQAESPKQKAAASQQLAEAALMQAIACDRIASALERLSLMSSEERASIYNFVGKPRFVQQHSWAQKTSKSALKDSKRTLSVVPRFAQCLIVPKLWSIWLIR